VAFGRLNESRGGAPRGERIPLDAQPRRKADGLRRPREPVCDARTTDGAPVGAPPPCLFVRGGKGFRAVHDHDSDATASRERICLSVHASTPSPALAVGRVGETARAMSRGGGNHKAPPTLDPSPPRALRAGGGKARTLTCRENGFVFPLPRPPAGEGRKKRTIAAAIPLSCCAGQDVRTDTASDWLIAS
jgi:hypothetical protein